MTRPHNDGFFTAVRATGKVNIIGLLMLAGIAGAIYWVIMFSPAYLDHIDATDAVRGAFNTWGRQNEESIRSTILARFNDPKLGWHRENDAFGAEKIVGGIGITDENITIEADEVARFLRIRVDYQREVILKPTKSRKYVRFKVEEAGPFPHP